MDWSLTLLDGDDAITTLRGLAADGRWQRLAAATPAPTCFQEPPYVLAWYEAYAGACRPLVALARDGDEPVGLLALAERPGREIVIAGANHAWYESWLALPEVGDDFIVAAVDRVLESRRPRAWRWKYLMRGLSANWVDALRTGGGIVTEYAAPVWDLSLPDAIDRLVKPRLRNYINRYQKAGELVLTPVTGDDAARAVRVVAPWSDLRHGAVRADLPFRDDPRKADLHARLARAGDAIHTSVLSCAGRPLAVHQGNWDGERLFIGLYAFDPTEARQSPGNILMIELARHVLERGGREIDLTPGGEGWKEEFANRLEPVYRVELFADSGRRRLRRIQRGALESAKTLLGAIGVAPDDVRRLAGSLRPAPEPDALEIFEVAITGEEPPVDPPAPLDGVDAPWLDRILSIDEVHDRDDAAAFLSLSSRLISRGWRPLTHDTEPAPGTILWAQPRDVACVVPAEPGPEPVTLVRNPGNAPAGLPVPDDAAVVLVGRDLGDTDVLVDLLAEARACCARDRVWVVATRLAPATRAWLESHGTPVAARRSAA